MGSSTFPASVLKASYCSPEQVISSLHPEEASCCLLILSVQRGQQRDGRLNFFCLCPPAGHSGRFVEVILQQQLLLPAIRAEHPTQAFIRVPAKVR